MDQENILPSKLIIFWIALFLIFYLLSLAFPEISWLLIFMLVFSIPILAILGVWSIISSRNQKKKKQRKESLLNMVLGLISLFLSIFAFYLLFSFILSLKELAGLA